MEFKALPVHKDMMVFGGLCRAKIHDRTSGGNWSQLPQR